MEARIRPAVAPDLFWLRLLLGQLVEEMGPTYPQTMPKDLEAMTAVLASRLASNDPTLMCFVAEADAVIGGFVQGDLLSRVSTPHAYLFVPYLYVVPGWRLDGTGRSLSTAIIQAAKAQGAEAVEFLSVPGDDQWSRRGWPVTSLVHALPVDAALASIAPTVYSNGHGHASTEE